MSKKKLLWILGVPLALVLLFFGLFQVLRGAAAERWDEAEAHLAAHAEELQPDVHALLKGREPTARDLDVARLPASLRIPHLRFAELGEKHVNLVLYTSPDVTSGFRIWAGERSADYADERTSVPLVDRFCHNDDLPSSPSNQP